MNNVIVKLLEAVKRFGVVVHAHAFFFKKNVDNMDIEENKC